MYLKFSSKTTLWLAALLFMFSLNQPTISYADEDNKKWYTGGTLHKATVSDWRKASSENKLATASDWLSATLWKEHLTSPDAFVKMKVKTEMLVAAINDVAESDGISSMSVTEIAASIVLISNDLGPD